VLVVPITILLTDRELHDRRTDLAVVHEAIERGEGVRTRPPSVIDYLDAIESSGAQGAVIVTPAAEFTEMWRHARNAAWLADRPVCVVDSRTAASGQSLVVDTAADAAAAGSSWAEVASVARHAGCRARVVGVVGAVEGLVAGGMPSPARAAAGGGSRLRPTVFEARDGRVEPLQVVEDEDPPAMLANFCRQGGSPVVFTSGEPSWGVRDMAERLAQLVGSRRPVEACSAAMTVHIGRVEDSRWPSSCT
jgi:fatty acid-binding protein DegV